MHKVYITGSGLWVPPNLISNDELVVAYNEYAKLRWKKRQSSWINSSTPPRPVPSSLSTSTTQTCRWAASASSARSGRGIRLGVVC